MEHRCEKQSRRHHDQRRHDHDEEIVAEREPERVALEKQPFEIEPARPDPGSKTVPVIKGPNKRGERRQQNERGKEHERWPNEKSPEADASVLHRPSLTRGGGKTQS